MRRPRVRVLLVLAAALLLLAGAASVVVVVRVLDGGAAPAASAAPQPVVEGNRLVDRRTGRTWVPRGVNWSSLEYACAQGWGFSSLEAGGTDPMATQAAAIAGWGADTVRLPLNQDCWLGTRAAPVSDEYTERTPAGYRAHVGAFVEALNAEGLVVVLDLHSRKRIGTPEFGNLAMPDAESLAFWRSVAQAHADNPSVMFDAFNEPYSRYDAADRLVFELTWECWRDGGCAAPAEDDRTATTGRTTYAAQGMQAVVDAIRGAGAEQPVLLGGLDYANDLSRWSEYRPDDDQLVAAFHAYDFKECATRECWDEVLAPLASSVPVLTSELGATDPLDGWVAGYLDWADRHGVGALFWVWADHAGDPMSLGRGLSGEPTAWGRLARSWMRAS